MGIINWVSENILLIVLIVLVVISTVWRFRKSMKNRGIKTTYFICNKCETKFRGLQGGYANTSRCSCGSNDTTEISS